MPLSNIKTSVCALSLARRVVDLRLCYSACPSTSWCYTDCAQADSRLCAVRVDLMLQEYTASEQSSHDQKQQCSIMRRSAVLCVQKGRHSRDVLRGCHSPSRTFERATRCLLAQHFPTPLLQVNPSTSMAGGT